ncbi:Aldo/keto reductase [Aspergillus ibericus CBS 121593]|uniref:Aldo/keto reductase n=1 Tax=Aspergillus ibericus CBS 121593 TaxID=1448316 RepID=A0A395HAP0_9EURO|nr:Aldo/keto reductase [Aspergillus ibericus CBS 121593]RAL05011.1 Aldo/keto reductase [Aspergillus ibericus CBS 121593]
MTKTMKAIQFVKWNDGASVPQLGNGCVDSITAAIRLGYHHLDGAEISGTEAELGLAIRESGVEQEKLFASSKEAWASMERVKAAGKARSIGVFNFMQDHPEAIEFYPYLRYGKLLQFHENQEKYAAGEGEILLRWAMDRGSISITPSSKESPFSSYLQILTVGQLKHFMAFWQKKFAATDWS